VTLTLVDWFKPALDYINGITNLTASKPSLSLSHGLKATTKALT